MDKRGISGAGLKTLVAFLLIVLVFTSIYIFISPRFQKAYGEVGKTEKGIFGSLEDIRELQKLGLDPSKSLDINELERLRAESPETYKNRIEFQIEKETDLKKKEELLRMHLKDDLSRKDRIKFVLELYDILAKQGRWKEAYDLLMNDICSDELMKNEISQIQKDKMLLSFKDILLNLGTKKENRNEILSGLEKSKSCSEFAKVLKEELKFDIDLLEKVKSLLSEQIIELNNLKKPLSRGYTYSGYKNFMDKVWEIFNSVDKMDVDLELKSAAKRYLLKEFTIPVTQEAIQKATSCSEKYDFLNNYLISKTDKMKILMEPMIKSGYGISSEETREWFETNYWSAENPLIRYPPETLHSHKFLIENKIVNHAFLEDYRNVISSCIKSSNDGDKVKASQLYEFLAFYGLNTQMNSVIGNNYYRYLEFSKGEYSGPKLHYDKYQKIWIRDIDVENNKARICLVIPHYKEDYAYSRQISCEWYDRSTTWRKVVDYPFVELKIDKFSDGKVYLYYKLKYFNTPEVSSIYGLEEGYGPRSFGKPIPILSGELGIVASYNGHTLALEDRNSKNFLCREDSSLVKAKGVSIPQRCWYHLPALKVYVSGVTQQDQLMVKFVYDNTDYNKFVRGRI